MNVVARSVSVNPDKSYAVDRPSSVPLSRSDVVIQKSGSVLYLKSFRGDDFKRWFAPAFAHYVRAQFDTPEQVAAAFGVRNSTAWNWWNGDNRASGDAVARLFMTFPDAASWFMQEWEKKG